MVQKGVIIIMVLIVPIALIAFSALALIDNESTLEMTATPNFSVSSRNITIETFPPPSSNCGCITKTVEHPSPGVTITTHTWSCSIPYHPDQLINIFPSGAFPKPSINTIKEERKAWDDVTVSISGTIERVDHTRWYGASLHYYQICDRSGCLKIEHPSSGITSNVGNSISKNFVIRNNLHYVGADAFGPPPYLEEA